MLNFLLTVHRQQWWSVPLEGSGLRAQRPRFPMGRGNSSIFREDPTGRIQILPTKKMVMSGPKKQWSLSYVKLFFLINYGWPCWWPTRVLARISDVSDNSENPLDPRNQFCHGSSRLDQDMEGPRPVMGVVQTLVIRWMGQRNPTCLPPIWDGWKPFKMECLAPIKHWWYKYKWS